MMAAPRLRASVEVTSPKRLQREEFEETCFIVEKETRMHIAKDEQRANYARDGNRTAEKRRFQSG